jgi:hypothetical protein
MHRAFTGIVLPLAARAGAVGCAEPCRAPTPTPHPTPAPSTPLRIAASSYASVEVHLNARRIGDSWYEEDASLSGPSRIAISYGQPHARGRKVEGGLMPLDTVWRFGANMATTLHTDLDITLGDLKLPRGDYSLFVLYTRAGYSLIVNRGTGQWGTDRDTSKDLGRVALASRTMAESEPSLSIYPGAGVAKAGNGLRRSERDPSHQMGYDRIDDQLASGSVSDERYPIGKFTSVQQLSTAERAAAIEQIAAAPANFRRAVAGLDEAQLDTPYRTGGWTVRQVAHHLPDSHMNAYMRFSGVSPRRLLPSRPTKKRLGGERRKQRRRSPRRSIC